MRVSTVTRGSKVAWIILVYKREDGSHVRHMCITCVAANGPARARLAILYKGGYRNAATLSASLSAIDVADTM
jgi:hypothetical protein